MIRSCKNCYWSSETGCTHDNFCIRDEPFMKELAKELGIRRKEEKDRWEGKNK